MDNYDYIGKDPSHNVSYEEKGINKISIDIIVPDYLVSLLIGKNGECIRGIMTKSGSMITFQKEVKNYLIKIK
jgi:transcription antitermination factor NusA-like protein